VTLDAWPAPGSGSNGAVREADIAGNRRSSIIRAAALTAGLCAYLISPDDVVWRFIKTSPNAHALEHAAFALAAAVLGLALLLKVKAAHSRIAAVAASLLQAIGIGSLLPLPGFLLLVLSDVAASLFLYGGNSIAEAGKTLPAFRWKDALASHFALCLAFLSMAIFSATLIDRLADVLFGITAVVSIAANAQTFLKH
jgi:hypothetical protein